MTIKKWILFFLLTPFIYILFDFAIAAPLVLMIAKIFNIVYPTADIADSTLFDFCLCLPDFVSPIALYLCTKIFGLFDYVDKLKINFFLKSLFVFAISLTLFLIVILFYLISGAGVRDWFYFSSRNFFFLIPLFFIYKFFQFLTKKFPVPFETLAYYFSVEFYKSIVNKLFKKIKNKLT